MQPSSRSSARLLLPFGSVALETLQPLMLVAAFQLGAALPVNGHNPINFCNGLLFGNAFSLLALAVVKKLSLRAFEGEPVWAWNSVPIGIVPIITGSLLEAALVISLSRLPAIQVTLAVALTSLLLLLVEKLCHRVWPSPVSVLGALLVVVASVIVSTNESSGAVQSMAAMGESLVPNTPFFNHLLLAGVLALSVLFFRASSPAIEKMGSLNFAILLTASQTFIFFIWATTTFGLTHIYDLRSPLLWHVMLIYGALISTAYTLVEATALITSGPLLVSMFEGLAPFFSGLFAWLLLRQPFTFSLLASSLLAALGIICIELVESRAEPVDPLQ